jgi:Raf kinase inhibitor-like YbhB/YbcL family protein
MFEPSRRIAALVFAIVAAALSLGARPLVQQSAFRISSPDFAADGVLPSAYGLDKMKTTNCGGQNVAPALQWSGSPAGTKSFALIMHDPDAKGAPGGDWVHWVIYGIPGNVNGLAHDAGHGNGPYVEGKSGFGFGNYGGPCPPVGDAPHHYNFVLYATDLAPSALAPGLDRGAVEAAIKGHTLGTATLIGLYQRKQG